MKENNEIKGTVFKNEKAWEKLNKTVADSNFSKIFILTDENTSKYCLPHFLKKQNFSKPSEVITIPAGEEHKIIETCLSVWNELSEKGADRNSLLINLGGGMITDLGGFVASTFRRGISFINIPTSLLAMVDASVGGKNGVDLGHIKNQIGVINSANFVVLDSDFLKSLPKEQLNSGMAEMLKHGLIHSDDYWNQVKSCNRFDDEVFQQLIWDSILIKKEIVEKDPFETGIRKTLNYGHTLGHAIESYFLKNSNKTELLHGEAVAIGLILATYISHKLLDFPEKKLEDITSTILSRYQKQIFSEDDIAEIIKFLIFDKKNVDGKVLFVLLKDIGESKTNCIVDNELIYSSFEYYKNY